jgi:hypothetical protein
MPHRDKLIREWVKHGYLPPEAVGRGPVARHAPGAGRARKREAPAEAPLAKGPEEIPLDVLSSGIPRNGQRPEAGLFPGAGVRSRSSILPIVLGIVTAAWMGLIGFLVYLKYFAG